METLYTKRRRNAMPIILLTSLVIFSWCEFVYPVLPSIAYKVKYVPDTPRDKLDNSNQPVIQPDNMGSNGIPRNGTSNGNISEFVNHRRDRREWPSQCLPTTERIKCMFSTCIRVSVVGLCNAEQKDELRRELPTSFRCPKVSLVTRVILQHADNPESIAESDIVLFNSLPGRIDSKSWMMLRQFRSLGQMWVFQTGMSPLDETGPLPPRLFREVTFNVSNTYLASADISSPYGYYEPHRSEESHKVVNFSEIHSDKFGFMVWISRNCETPHWNRTAFVRDLQKVMDVDIFNECGNNTTSSCQDRFDTDCIKEVDELIRPYKFYLAIESSCCEDYLTGSFWHAFSIGTIPVVIGPRIENYQKLAPPNSFIHVDQFDSVEHLNKYLQYLSKNSTAYSEYFKWRLTGTVREHSSSNHYENHLSNEVMCSMVDQYLIRKDSPTIRGRMFDPYGSEWRGTCHECGEHQWIRDYV